MISKFISISSLCLILSLSFSCTEDSEPQPLDSDLFIDVREVHASTNSTPYMVLHIQSKDTLPCANYHISTYAKQDNGILNINILGTEIGDICLTALGPATASLPLSENVHQIVLIGNGESDRYDISISKNAVEVEPVVTTFTERLHSKVLRYPENSFALICGTHPDYADICDNFRSSLLNNIPGLEEFEFGIGKIPYPDSSQGNWINTPSTYYIYQNEAEFNKAGELLHSYAQLAIEPNSGVSIWLTNWKNESFRSWMLE